MWDGKQDLVLTVLVMAIVIISYRSTLSSTESLSISLQYPGSQFQQKHIVIGAWAPSKFHLEKMPNPEQRNAISTLLGQGFGEYYFVMRDFNNASERKATEQLLDSADKTSLKITIVLLPPSEVDNYGPSRHANYDWKGWIIYFNSLKERHPTSFLGFALDDFNSINAIRRLYVMNNMYLMASSNFSGALDYKRKDVEFYPVMYLETGGFETLKRNYDKFLAGIILVNTLSSSNYNVSQLGKNVTALSKMFVFKPLEYIVYPSKDVNNALSAHLIVTTLSIASRLFNGIVIYVRTDNYVVQDFLQNLHNQRAVEMTKK
jgi:hypothetical protein